MSGNFWFGASSSYVGGNDLSLPHFSTARRVLTASSWKSLGMGPPSTAHLLLLPSNLMRLPWSKLFGRSSTVSPSISHVYPLKPSSRSVIDLDFFCSTNSRVVMTHTPLLHVSLFARMTCRSRARRSRDCGNL